MRKVVGDFVQALITGAAGVGIYAVLIGASSAPIIFELILGWLIAAMIWAGAKWVWRRGV